MVTRWITWAIRDLFGRDIETRLGGGRPHFRITRKHKLDGAAYIYPANSEDFEDVEMLRFFPGGSVAAFEQREWLENRQISNVQFGILLRDEENCDLLEIFAEPGMPDVLTVTGYYF